MVIYDSANLTLKCLAPKSWAIFCSSLTRATFRKPYEVEGRGKNRTQRMVIYYKFVGYLEIPSRLSAPNYKADLRQGVAVEYVSCEPSITARELFDEEYGAVVEEQ